MFLVSSKNRYPATGFSRGRDIIPTKLPYACWTIPMTRPGEALTCGRSSWSATSGSHHRQKMDPESHIHRNSWDCIGWGDVGYHIPSFKSYSALFVGPRTPPPPHPSGPLWHVHAVDYQNHDLCRPPGVFIGLYDKGLHKWWISQSMAPIDYLSLGRLFLAATMPTNIACCRKNIFTLTTP